MGERVLEAKVKLDVTQPEAASKRLTQVFNGVTGAVKGVSNALRNKISLYKLQTTVMSKAQKLGISNVNIENMSRKSLMMYNAELSRQIILLPKATTGSRRFRGQIMGIGFAALFGGMALYRVFGGALKSLFANYKEVMDQTSMFNQMTNNLSGAWTYFKFTLIDALSQSGLFQMIVGFLIKLINGIAEFTSKHTDITTIVVVFMSLVAVIGLLAEILGQPILMLSFMGNSANIAAGKLLVGFGKAIGIIAILAVVIWAVVKIWDSGMSNWAKWLSTIGVLIVAVGASMWIMGGKARTVLVDMIGASFTWLAANPVVLFITGIVALVALLFVMGDAMGGLGNLFKSVIAGIVKMFVALGGVIVDFVLAPVQALMWGVRKLQELLGMENTGLGKVADRIFNAVKNLRSVNASAVLRGIENVDVAFGMQGVRDKMGLNDSSSPWNTFKASLGLGTSGPGDFGPNISDNTSFGYNAPVLIDKTAEVANVSKQNLDAQNIANDYAAEDLDVSYENLDLGKQRNNYMSQMVDFMKAGNQAFNITSTTTK